MKYELHGGPMDGEETEVPAMSPWPWLRIVVQDAVPIPTYETLAPRPPPMFSLPIANYRLVRYKDGRLGYEYECMDPPISLP